MSTVQTGSADQDPHQDEEQTAPVRSGIEDTENQEETVACTLEAHTEALTLNSGTQSMDPPIVWRPAEDVLPREPVEAEPDERISPESNAQPL